MGLLLPTHVAKAEARKRVKQQIATLKDTVPALAPLALPKLADGDVVNAIEAPIPEGIPIPELWRVALMPVGQRRRSKGLIELPPEMMDVQNWTHLLFKVVAIGEQVYEGRAYEGYTNIRKPQLGDLYLTDAKNPRRYRYQDKLIIVVNDDQLWSRVLPGSVEFLSFNGIDL
jgi:hypothetical protein